MIELYLSKVTETSETEQAGKLYARVSYKQSMGIQEMAHHMAEHNTMFSEGSITGILIDFVKCVREMVLMGNTVKIDNLAIFKATVEANGLEVLYDAQQDKVASASIGTLAQGAKTGPAVKVIKLLAQSTGDFTRDELKKDVKLSWTDKTKAEIAAAKGSLTPDPSPTGEGSENQGGSGSQSQQNSVAAPVISGVSPFEETSQVSISGPDGATIYYSENGDDPDSNDTLYTQPFTIDETTTIKAVAIKDGVSSQVTTKVFTKGTSGSGGFETGS
ncbi:MAG: chitobiase/beta-hexosaminidase C-terminal domain-containing protein [Bacteroidales bacterium]|nr:chitobiase/beta-hexosaminidase C-terminal domain-containing protein [Bacteroidales bacterium]